MHENKNDDFACLPTFLHGLRMFAHGLRMSVHDLRMFTHEDQNEHFACLHTVISVMHGLHMFRYGQPSRKSWLLEEKGSR